MAEMKKMKGELSLIKSAVSSINADCKTASDRTGEKTCTCKTGFQRVNGVCSDIDECNDQNDCDPNATCSNTEGSYSCDCLQGFYGDGKTCQKGYTSKSFVETYDFVRCIKKIMKHKPITFN